MSSQRNLHVQAREVITWGEVLVGCPGQPPSQMTSLHCSLLIPYYNLRQLRLALTLRHDFTKSL